MILLITHLNLLNLHYAAKIQEKEQAATTREENRERYEALVETMNDLVWEVNQDRIFTYVSPRSRDLLGYDPQEVIGKAFSDFRIEPERKRVQEIFHAASEARKPFWRVENTLLRRNGQPLAVESSAVPLFDKKSHLLGYLGTDHDVTAGKVAEPGDEHREAILERILKASPMGIGLVENRVFRWANLFFLEMVGYSAEEIKGKSARMIYESDAEFERVEWMKYQDMAQQGFGAIETRFRRKDGTLIDIYLRSVPLSQDPLDTGVCFTAMDITDRKRYERELEYRATHDPLTGLVNRRLLEGQIMQSLAYASRSGKNVAFILLDLDRFKQINDTLGHSAGDFVLNEVARRLTASVRKYDTVVRFGGDEFAIVLSEITDLVHVDALAQKIFKNLSYPMRINQHELQIGASLGIACFPRDGKDAESLIHKADLAMYRAKQFNGGICNYASLEMTVKTKEIFGLEAELRNALKEKEFVLLCQPQIAVQKGCLVGYEALLRWQHPTKGFLKPCSFLPSVEEGGLGIPLGRWVLEELCRQSKVWETLGGPSPRIVLSLSSHQLRRESLAQNIGEIFQQMETDPQRFCLELTESMVLQDIPTAGKNLERLRDLGFRLQLAEFGTGFGNFKSLGQVQVDYLKLDRSFVTNLFSDPSAALAVRCILAVARQLGITSVADGVETTEQLRFLRDHGCDEFQGGLVSQPLSPEGFLNFLKSGCPHLNTLPSL
jgi:diguanylate cyclase (GGDEF)-like protein/PAS domain S-box-containing protein